MPLQEHAIRRTLMDVPYPVLKNGNRGVSRVATNLRTHMGPLGYEIIISGQPTKDPANNAADIIHGYHLSVSHLGTRHDSKIVFRKSAAGRVAEAAGPLDLAVFHEPMAAHSAHPLISAMKKRADGKTEVCSIATFHGSAENLDRRTATFAWVMGKKNLIRRPQLRRPFMTRGYSRTINDGLEGRTAVSSAAKKAWDSYFHGEVIVIPNGTDVSVYKPERTHEMNWSEDTLTFLFVGALEGRKDIPTLLDAFSLFLHDLPSDGLAEDKKNAQLAIIGQGNTTTILEKIQQLNLQEHVQLLGYQDDATVAAAYGDSDYFVSTPKDGESFGLVLIEAAASGKGVLGTKTGGYTEVLDSLPFAWAAEPGNARDIADKMLEMARLPRTMREEKGRLTRAYTVANYSWEEVAHKYDQYFEICIQRHHDTLTQPQKAQVYP